MWDFLNDILEEYKDEKKKHFERMFCISIFNTYNVGKGLLNYNFVLRGSHHTHLFYFEMLSPMFGSKKYYV